MPWRARWAERRSKSGRRRRVRSARTRAPAMSRARMVRKSGEVTARAPARSWRTVAAAVVRVHVEHGFDQRGLIAEAEGEDVAVPGERQRVADGGQVHRAADSSRRSPGAAAPAWRRTSPSACRPTPPSTRARLRGGSRSSRSADCSGRRRSRRRCAPARRATSAARPCPPRSTRSARRGRAAGNLRSTSSGPASPGSVT